MIDSIVPNFFIIGAPKCGTTALSEYLKMHSKILFSNPKEPWYFSHDLVGSSNYKSYSDYINKCYANYNIKHVAIGEGSVIYMYSDTAVSEIMSINKDAKFIVMIRQPIDMVCSLYYQLLRDGQEDSESFVTAWRLQYERSLGRSLPRLCKIQKLLQYGLMGKFSIHLSKLYNLVPKENILVIKYDNFFNNPAEGYQCVLEFLSVDNEPVGDFPVVNAAIEPKSLLLHKAINTIAYYNRRFGIDGLGVGQMLRNANSKPLYKKTLPENFILELSDYFYDDILKTANITGLDLTNWLHPINK